jgi:3'-phosphoadenosine 5'-phosphosulfate sulfotransferase (PAPS reductase)/FAD synthetase
MATTATLIQDTLGSGDTLTTKQLAAATGKSACAVNRYAGKLVALGALVKVDGGYRLATAPVATTEDGPEDLASYDIIVVSTSGGKDSQTTMRLVARLAREAGVLDRVVAVHANLGERVEWPDAPEYAERQARMNGVERFEVTSRIGGIAKKDSSVYKAGEEYGDLLDYAERRGAWPSKAVRYCTSEFKRGPIGRVYTDLAREWRASTGESRPCRILDCIGIRAEESVSRAKKPQFEVRRSTRNVHVDVWLPIKHWSTEQVWEDIRESGVPHHWAYDKGMRRLSCVFCVFGGLQDLLIAGQENPEILDAWVASEERMGHKFQQNRALAEVREMLREAPAIAAQGSFCKTCDNL